MLRLQKIEGASQSTESNLALRRKPTRVSASPSTLEAELLPSTRQQLVSGTRFTSLHDISTSRTAVSLPPELLRGLHSLQSRISEHIVCSARFSRTDTRKRGSSRGLFDLDIEARLHILPYISLLEAHTIRALSILWDFCNTAIALRAKLYGEQTSRA